MIRVSVILPVLNEAATLPQILSAIADWANPVPTAELEIIVVDGGSQDNSVAIAQQHGAIVLTSLPGRALQMNTGAAIAQGQILLFLHADTRLPPDFVRLAEQTLNQPQVSAGAFDLRIDGSAWGLRGVEWGVYWRSRLWQLPYGDQAIFLFSKTFHAVAGFPNQPIMEDVVLIRRLQHLGRIAIAPAAVTTSDRRWQRLGILQTTALNQLILLGDWLGIPPQRLAQWYRCQKEEK